MSKTVLEPSAKDQGEIFEDPVEPAETWYPTGSSPFEYIASTFNSEIFRGLVSYLITLVGENGPSFNLWHVLENPTKADPKEIMSMLGRILASNSGASNFHSNVTALLGNAGSGYDGQPGYLLANYGTRVSRSGPIPRQMLRDAISTLSSVRTEYGADGRSPTYPSTRNTYLEALRSMFNPDIAAALLKDEENGGHPGGAITNGLSNVSPVSFKKEEIDAMLSRDELFTGLDAGLWKRNAIDLVINGLRAPDVESDINKVVGVPMGNGVKYVSKVATHCDLTDNPLAIDTVNVSIAHASVDKLFSIHARQDYSEIKFASLLSAMSDVFKIDKTYNVLPIRSSMDHGEGIVIENLSLHKDVSEKQSTDLIGETVLTLRINGAHQDTTFRVTNPGGDDVEVPITQIKFVCGGLMRTPIIEGGPHRYEITFIISTILEGTESVPRLRRSPDIKLSQIPLDYNDDRNFAVPNISTEEGTSNFSMHGAIMHGVPDPIERKSIISKLRSYDVWSGLPLSSGSLKDEDLLEKHRSLLRKILFRVPNEDMNLLRYSGIEYDDINEIFSSTASFEAQLGITTYTTGSALVERLASNFMHLILSIYGIVLSNKEFDLSRESLDNPALSHVIDHFKEKLQREIYDSSVISTMHDKLWFTSVDPSVAPDNRINVNIMLARYLLSLTHNVAYQTDRDRHRATLLLPPRINKAKYIPVSLTESGYRAMTPTVSVVNAYFMKETTTRKILSSYIKKNFSEHKMWRKVIESSDHKGSFKTLNSDSTSGEITLHTIVRAPLLEVTYDDVKDGTYSHCIICDNCKIITLDYLIQSTIHQLYNKRERSENVITASSNGSKAMFNMPSGPRIMRGELSIIYDKWFILLFVLPEDDNANPLVMIQTSTRAARVVPHSKNTNSSLRRVRPGDTYEVLMQSAVSSGLLYMDKTIEWSDNVRVSALLEERQRVYE
jgi:hypothetical protein